MRRPVAGHAERPVLVPREDAPLAIPVCVAVKIEVFPHVVRVLRDAAEREQIQQARRIHVIPKPRPPRVHVGLIEPSDERLQIGVPFKLSRLLFHRIRGIGEDRRARSALHEFVKRTFLIETARGEEFVVHLLDVVADAVRTAVDAQHCIERHARRMARETVGLERERRTNVTSIASRSVEVRLVHTSGFGVDETFLARVEIELLRACGCEAAARTYKHVVVKLAIEIDRRPRSGRISRVREVVREPFPQWDVRRHRLHHGAEVFGGIQRVGEKRESRGIRARIARCDIPANHLPGSARGVGNHRAVNAVARSAVAMRTVVEHGRLDERVIHHAIVQRDARNRRERLLHLGSDCHRLKVGRLRRRVLRIYNHRSGNPGARDIQPPGRWRSEIPRARGKRGNVRRDKLRAVQEIVVPRAEIERMNR